jgi:hypothetical protein
MALSPADYAAYSRATGTPYPEDPEERAQITPAVLEFRRNQLRAPQEESNLPGILGAAALGLGALAGGVGIARALAGKRGQASASTASTLPKNTEQVVSTVSAAPLRQQIAEEVVRQARTERPLGTVLIDLPQPKTSFDPWSGKTTITDPFGTGTLPYARTDLPISRTPGTFREFSRDVSGASVADRLSQDPELLSLVQKQAAEELSEARSFQSKAQAEYRNLISSIADDIIAQERAAVRGPVVDQAIGALESGEDQMTGRMKAQLSRNEDLDMSQVEILENIAQQNNALMRAQAEPSQMIGYVPDEPINQAAAQLPDGIPIDQAEGVTVRELLRQGKPILDLRQRQAVRVSPRALGLEQEQDPLVQEARQYLRAQEIDTDFDYSAENIRQAAQVRDRIETAQALQNQANQILAELQAERPVVNEQLSPQEFAAAFNKKYREELNPELQLVDNARQRQELRGAQAAVEGEDVVSLLLGDVPEVESTMRGKALRGGKLNRAGDISYMDESGQEYASADTGVKARQGQGEQYKARAERLNKLRSASDEELTDLVLQGQQALANNQPITKLDADTTRFASQLLQTRAVNNPEPTRLQLDALDRARASIAATQEILQSNRNPRPTIAPGPAQDVARAMETLRRGMIVDPSEPLPELPSVQQLRTGYASDEEIGPILGASDVYTSAAAEAAGPVIFTGKSKANTVLRTPPITGSIGTPTGRYFTQDNPDVLGTVYNVAGTPANRAIAAQVEANAQSFLADAVAGGLQAKGVRAAEPYVTPARLPGPIPPPAQGPALPSLGMPGIDPSKRTLYSQYRQGVSSPTPLSPFIGEMSGGTVVVAPPTTTTPGIRRDIGAPAQSIDLTRRGEKSRYFSLYPQQEFVTGIEPAPIGPVTQSAGLSRIGGMTQQTVQGAGGLPVTQLTPQGQRIAYPRMDKPAKALGFRGETVTNVPRYGINPGAEDWRDDLMRSAFRRGGPIRTSPADPRQLGIEGRGLDLLLEYLNRSKP